MVWTILIQMGLINSFSKSSKAYKGLKRFHGHTHIHMQQTYSALKLRASQSQATCSEYSNPPLLLLHHSEAVTISPTKNMHTISPSQKSK